MLIYDTLSGKKKKLTKPRGERPLRLFVCGPTVYDAPHMGHARTYVAFDAVVRFLRSRGFNIFFLENITNVDDKIIVRARERKTDPFTLALQYENEFHTAMRVFGVGTVDLYARASEFIPAIIIDTPKGLAPPYCVNCCFMFEISFIIISGSIGES